MTEKSAGTSFVAYFINSNNISAGFCTVKIQIKKTGIEYGCWGTSKHMFLFSFTWNN